jgi:hypothetical protein
MAFINGNNDKLEFILTQLGQQTLATKGLEKKIFYYNLFDQEVNYLIGVKPDLVVDLTGSKKSIIPNSINFNSNLIS